MIIEEISSKRLKEVMKAKCYKAFCRWMAGQTIKMRNGETFIYSNDLLRWLEKLSVAD